MTVNPAPGGNILQGARIRADHLQLLAIGHLIDPVLGADHRHRAQQATGIELRAHTQCSPTCQAGRMLSGAAGATVIWRQTPSGWRISSVTASPLRPCE